MSSSKEDMHKRLDAYVKGQLAEDQIEELWAEIARNPSLLDDLEIEVGLKKILREKSAETPAPVRKLPSWTWHASAAAVILLVALVQLFSVDTPTELHEFVLTDIKADQIETGMGVRSKEVVLSSADSLLNLGFEAAFSKNDTRALELFDEVITAYNQEPYGSKAFLNKGIVLYNRQQYELAIDAFLESSRLAAEDSMMILEKAYWFLANAYVNTGQLEKALEAAATTYEMEGVFEGASFRLYQKLAYDLGQAGSE